MKTLSLLALALASALTAPLALVAQTAGMTEGKLRAAHHGGSKMDYIVWYPAQAEAETGEFAGNAVWQPVMAADDAPPIAGRYPVVLMSHGLGGHYRSLAWLASDWPARVRLWWPSTTPTALSLISICKQGWRIGQDRKI